MCGIAGWLGHVEDAPAVAACAGDALRHRGPDARGVRLWPRAALVHARLSIIDLSPAGAEPMPNEDETVWVVFNGEIYNHHELRRELEALGHRFRGRSDAEVIPHLYEEQGARCFSKLRGMFAIAIYATRTRTLLLGRDRFGIKPLFYSITDERLAFASELNALRAIPGVDDRPSSQALGDFASLFYVPAPDTFYRGIRALEPGEQIEARLTPSRVQAVAQRYYRPSIALDRRLTLGEAADRASVLVREAVGRQLESDVPMGSLLSGGIDSSLVSAAAQARSGGLRTFNVRFPERDYDETWAALATAQQIGSEHRTLEMDSVPGTWEYVVSVLEQAGQPFADTSIFAVSAVCAAMRRHVTVALSGDGGDEGFGGYDFFWQIARIARLQRIPLALTGLGLLGTPLARMHLLPRHVPQRARELKGADDTDIVRGLLSGLDPTTHRRLCGDEAMLAARRWFEPRWTLELDGRVGRLERLSAHLTEALLRLTLPSDFLFKVDTASMRSSLEVRVPLLDEDLVSFGLTLPHALKVKGSTAKRVLREVAARQLPRDVAQKRKAGFAVPVDTWVDRAFKRQLEATLLGPGTPLRDIFRADVFEPWVRAFCADQPLPDVSRHGLYRAVIMLLSVHLALATPRPAARPVAAAVHTAAVVVPGDRDG